MLLTLLERPDRVKARRITLDAFLEVFNRPSLEQFLRMQLDQRLDPISLGDNLRTILFRVIDEAERSGWLTRMLEAAKGEFPKNQEFVQACDKALALLEAER